ncbi:hypothetical protein NG754_10585 [Aliarcobacter cryaerophilus]|uniref:hypothetical protein n=1 Tax=Aliarcobacter cryaerophilus TaxID=28198 RepID=UPI003DA636C9
MTKRTSKKEEGNKFLPSRKDYNYTTVIDRFEKYAFTYYFAYELAARNNYVAESLIFLKDLFDLYLVLDEINRSSSLTVTNIEKAVEKIFTTEEMCKIIISSLVDDFDNKQLPSKLNEIDFRELDNNISSLIYFKTDKLYEEYYVIYIPKEEQSGKFNKIYNPFKYIELDKSLTRYMNFRNNEESHNEEKDYKINEAKNDYFMVYQEIIDKNKDFSLNVIYPNYRVNLRDFTNTKIALNLNLPKTELLEYVEKIKDEYDSKNSIIRTRKELLKEKIKVNKTEQKKLHKAISSLDNKKIGDILFIYDYFFYNNQYYPEKDNNNIIKEIQIELTKFNGFKIKKETNEIKNKKDTLYKYISWDEYLEENPEFKPDDMGVLDDEKAALSTKSIASKYNLIKKYIDGDEPLYKTLIEL